MKLYFGRVAPTKPQQQQVEGGGWAWRYKVRIFDKHPHDKNILKDEDLPWAQVLMPVTAGSGAANYAQTPSINQGDTVSIAYYDDDEQQPIITGILPRTKNVSQSEPEEEGNTGYVPHTGFTENKPRNSKVQDDESNENNANSQPTKRPDQLAAAVGSTVTLADNCDPNAYKATAVSNEITNLLNEIGNFAGEASRIESMIVGVIDRVHALVNPYVGEMFNSLFEALVPILNAGLSALYKKVFAKVLAATGNPVAARLAAEAALIALRPAILALQEAIQLLAAKVVNEMLDKVEDLIRDTIDNNDQFSTCAGTQFNAALINSIITDIDAGMIPLLAAVAKILSGGFDTADAIRSSIDLVRDFAGGLLGVNQGGNKCKGLVKEYVIGVGAKDDVGDILSQVLESANIANSLIEDATGLENTLTRQFGDFPFLSQFSDKDSLLTECSTEPPETCYAPEVKIFGGRGGGAFARAFVGRYVDTLDGRTVTNKQGGVVSVEVLDGGDGYKYPPFVEIRDNCNLGIGAHARSVIENGKVTKIYIVTPGEGYPSGGEELFVVDNVEVISGGSGYTAGIVDDEYGGRYEIIVDDDGGVVTILPINIVQVPDIPVINIPFINPPIPPGGTIEPDPEDPTKGKIFYANGQFFSDASIGNGLNYKPVIVPLPTAEQIADGDVSDNITPRLLQTEVVQVIDCVES